MAWKNPSAKDLHTVIRKLDLEYVGTRRAPHPVYWYCLDGKKQLRITIPNVHGGSGSISTGFLDRIRKSLRLTTHEFERLVDCPLTAQDDECMIRTKLNLES